MLYLQGFFLFSCLISLLYYGLAGYAAIAFFRAGLTENSDEFQPPVTVLKPLCGNDWEGYDCLASFCQQDYPTYQIIFCVQEETDPSVALVQKLQASFPQVEIILAIGQPNLGINPKINNLANALPQIRHDFLVIVDSDIKVTPDYLKTILKPFQNPDIGVVTCLYRSVTQGWLAGFESLEIATTFVPKILTARLLEGMDFAFGSTIALRREVFDKIGGLARMANHLADDYQLGHLPVVAGYQGFLSSYVVEHHLGQVTLSEMLARQIRWQKCVRVERFWGYLGLFFTQGTVLSTFLLILTQASLLGWGVLLTLWLARYFTVYITAIALLQDATARQFWLWTPLRDFLTFGIWCYSFGGDRITWRGKTYQLLPNGQLSPLS